MKKLLSLLLFLTASGPALAFDLAGFLETMSLGTEVAPAPPQVDLATAPVTGLEVADGQTQSEAKPVTATPPQSGDLQLDKLWLMGVFR
jgi:hypothetical protein